MSFAILTTFLNHRENSQIYANRAKEASWTIIQRGFRNFSSWKLSQPPSSSFFSRPPLLSSPLNPPYEFDCVITPLLTRCLPPPSQLPPPPSIFIHPFERQLPLLIQAQDVASFPNSVKRFIHREAIVRSNDVDNNNCTIFQNIVLAQISRYLFFLFRFIQFFLDLFSNENGDGTSWNIVEDRRLIVDDGWILPISFAIY